MTLEAKTCVKIIPPPQRVELTTNLVEPLSVTKITSKSMLSSGRSMGFQRVNLPVLCVISALVALVCLPLADASSYDPLSPKEVSRLSMIGGDNNSTMAAIQSADVSLNKKSPDSHKVVKSRRHKKTAFVTTPTAAKGSSNRKSSTLSPEEAASLRRIQSEWKDLVDAGIAFNWKLHKPVLRKGVEGPTPHHLWVGPLSKNLWVWHFSFMGIEGTAFESGIYHGRLLLPKNYPGSPPRVQVFTPTGRFVPRADICLSASHFHPETWTATWTVRTLIESLRLHMLTAANEIGGMEATREQRASWAKASRHWSTDLTPSIHVDHAAMIEQGLFPAMKKREQIDEFESEEDEFVSSVPISYRDQGVEWQQVKEPRGLCALLKNPIKVALLGLCLLFVILNTT